MARTAEEVLEFDKLREILWRRTTSAVGHRAIDALRPTTDRAELEAAFALIRESMEYLREGSELGFGALADPAPWMSRIRGRENEGDAGKDASASDVAENNAAKNAAGNDGAAIDDVVPG